MHSGVKHTPQYEKVFLKAHLTTPGNASASAKFFTDPSGDPMLARIGLRALRYPQFSRSRLIAGFDALNSFQKLSANARCAAAGICTQYVLTRLGALKIRVL